MSKPWGKSDKDGYHHLAHHCADVAACFEAIADLPTVRSRLDQSAGFRLSDTHIKRLAVLVFLHDIGKLHPGFQAKEWPDGMWEGSLNGHLQEGAAILLSSHPPEAITRHLGLAALAEWGIDQDLVASVLAHHGRPVAYDTSRRFLWHAVPKAGYDPAMAATEIGAAMRAWFADAHDTSEKRPLPDTPDFQHLLCGIVSLADWIGSSREIFPFEAELNLSYMDSARARARRAMADIGLDVACFRGLCAGRVDFATLTEGRTPRQQQKLVGEYPLDERLLILEAETGSGKTEAALWRFARLFDAGLVDGLYFALPTRAAAIQLHRRVNNTARRMFQGHGPEAVLAVPGYIRSGDAEGQKLPKWKVRWDDDGQADEQRLMARWAAESTKRSLAAAIAVGTVDQAMLAALQVKHAHLRAAAISRSLLVIDEVHASDHYMTEIQRHLLKVHVDRGGYAMLMSATLGSVARSKWLGHRRGPGFEDAIAEPYPAVWGKSAARPLSSDPQEREERQKSVSMVLEPTMSAENGARIAIEAARAGARALVIRNTVAGALEVFEAVRKVDESLLLSVAGGPALHHSRFAAEDRALLDGAVETALSPEARPAAGVIVIGTQTVEQSLDIDADILITDLCPVDVLLQRIGRLHRHQIARPAGYEIPRCHVMTPEGGLAKLLKPTFEHGLGAIKANGGGDYVGIYLDVPGLELTRRLIADTPEWTIPEMNRFLVESATHPDRIESLCRELGAAWSTYSNKVYGKGLAERAAARGLLLPTGTPFADVRFPEDEDRIRTRLGAEGARIDFDAPIEGPFGKIISGLTLPAHWSAGITSGGLVTPASAGPAIRVTIDSKNFAYTRIGISRSPTSK